MAGPIDESVEGAVELVSSIFCCVLEPEPREGSVVEDPLDGETVEESCMRWREELPVELGGVVVDAEPESIVEPDLIVVEEGVVFVDVPAASKDV